MKTLDQIPNASRSIVKRIINGQLSTKLIEMGIYPGQEIEVLFKAPLGDPMAVQVEGYTLSLRLGVAALIEVE